MVTDRQGFLAAIAAVLLAGRGALAKLREILKAEETPRWTAAIPDHPGERLSYTKVRKISDLIAGDLGGPMIEIPRTRRHPPDKRFFRIVNLTEQ